MGGPVHVFGTATANAVQAASFVDLECDFEQRAHAAPANATPDPNYDLVVSGRVRQKGTLAVQPSSTTALVIDCDSLSTSGTVYDPTVDYAAGDCALAVAQQGGRICGTLCGRNAGFTF